MGTSSPYLENHFGVEPSRGAAASWFLARKKISASFLRPCVFSTVMKTNENQSKQNSAISLDRSLYEWVPRHELAEIVPQIVRAARTDAAAQAQTSASDDIVLSILVYC